MKSFKRALLMPWAGGFTYTQKVQGTASANLIAYWPMAEASGSVALDASGNGRNGAYTAVTLGTAGIGDGRTSASFNGTSSFNNVYSASLAGAFNGVEGSVALWMRVSGAAVWTDSTARRLINLSVDGSNNTHIRKDTTDNQLTFIYLAGGTQKNVTTTTVGGLTSWIHVAWTWSDSADAFKAYLNGAQVGVTQTGLGTWAGSLLSTQTVIGAQTITPAQVWNGTIAHTAIWTTPLSAAQILNLATV